MHCTARNNLALDSLSPLLLCIRAGVLKNKIHSFQRLALGLWHKEECPNETGQAEDGEEDICSVAGVLDEGRCDETLLYECMSAFC